jgi:hypothetical protein
MIPLPRLQPGLPVEDARRPAHHILASLRIPNFAGGIFQPFFQDLASGGELFILNLCDLQLGPRNCELAEAPLDRAAPECPLSYSTVSPSGASPAACCSVLADSSSAWRTSCMACAFSTKVSRVQSWKCLHLTLSSLCALRSCYVPALPVLQNPIIPPQNKSTLIARFTRVPYNRARMPQFDRWWRLIVR